MPKSSAVLRNVPIKASWLWTLGLAVSVNESYRHFARWRQHAIGFAPSESTETAPISFTNILSTKSSNVQSDDVEMPRDCPSTILTGSLTPCSVRPTSDLNVVGFAGQSEDISDQTKISRLTGHSIPRLIQAPGIFSQQQTHLVSQYHASRGLF